METLIVFSLVVEVALSVYGAVILAAQIGGRARVIWRLSEGDAR